MVVIFFGLCTAKKPEQSVLKVSDDDDSGGGIGEMLKDKTGVTGLGTLGVGVAAYLISKELYIVNSEVCNCDDGSRDN